MEIVKVETEVTKEVHELGLAVKGVIKAYKDATADGWQSGTDIPAILMASFQKLSVAIEGVEKVGGEFKEEPLKAALGVLLPVAEGIEMLIRKDEQAPA